MPKKKQSKKSKGHWEVTLSNGEVVITGYYVNARMAVGEALKKYPGSKVIDVSYIK